MQELTALFGIAATLAFGAASPGPSFVMVARLIVTRPSCKPKYSHGIR